MLDLSSDINEARVELEEIKNQYEDNSLNGISQKRAKLLFKRMYELRALCKGNIDISLETEISYILGESATYCKFPDDKNRTAAYRNHIKLINMKITDELEEMMYNINSNLNIENTSIIDIKMRKMKDLKTELENMFKTYKDACEFTKSHRTDISNSIDVHMEFIKSDINKVNILIDEINQHYQEILNEHAYGFPNMKVSDVIQYMNNLIIEINNYISENK